MLNTRMEAAQLRADMPLFTGPNWDFGSLRRVYEAIERIAFDDLGFDFRGLSRLPGWRAEASAIEQASLIPEILSQHD